MSTWKRLMEMIGEADYSPGWRRNAMWSMNPTAEREPKQAAPGPAKGPRPPATGPIVWRGAQMRDNDLFQMKKDQKTGKHMESGLIPALKQAGGTVSRAPDGSGIAVCPPGYRVDPSVWKDWSPTRSKAQVDATTGGEPVRRNAYDLKGGQAGQRNRLPVDRSKQAGVTKQFDVLIQARVSDANGKQSILVTKVVWAPVDNNSIEASSPEARQAKLDLLMDTDDPSELAQMFPSSEPKAQGNTLGKPPRPADMAPNPLASPSKVTWTRGDAAVSQPPERPSAWDDIDLTRAAAKKKV